MNLQIGDYVKLTEEAKKIRSIEMGERTGKIVGSYHEAWDRWPIQWSRRKDIWLESSEFLEKIL